MHSKSNLKGKYNQRSNRLSSLNQSKMGTNHQPQLSKVDLNDKIQNQKGDVSNGGQLKALENVNKSTADLSDISNHRLTKFKVQQAIETSDNLISYRIQIKQEEAQKMSKSINRYVRKANHHAEVRNKDFVKNVMEEKDEVKLARTKKL